MKEDKARPQKPAGVRKTAHGAKSDAVRDKAILALLSEKTLEAAGGAVWSHHVI
jgi:hypothetical protein